ncbi:MAG: hypothetical protein ACREQ5_15000 [Candidatus Dormibacteria bacterium]
MATKITKAELTTKLIEANAEIAKLRMEIASFAPSIRFELPRELPHTLPRELPREVPRTLGQRLRAHFVATFVTA